MLEPAVVRQPLVTNKSLWAIGTPVSVVAVPLAMRASASAAWASVSARSTCKKVFELSASMRSRKCVASATAEISLFCKSVDSCLMDFVCMAFLFSLFGEGGYRGVAYRLLDDFRYQVQAVLH